MSRLKKCPAKCSDSSAEIAGRLATKVGTYSSVIYHAVILCSAASTAIKNGENRHIINVISFHLNFVLNCESYKFQLELEIGFGDFGSLELSSL